MYYTDLVMSCRYCCMDALRGRKLNEWRKSFTATRQEYNFSCLIGILEIILLCGSN